MEITKAKVGGPSKAEKELVRAALDEMDEADLADEEGFVLLSELGKQAFPGTIARYSDIPIEMAQVILSTLCRKNVLWVARCVYTTNQLHFVLTKMRIPVALIIAKDSKCKLRNLQQTTRNLTHAGSHSTWSIVVEHCPEPSKCMLTDVAKSVSQAERQGMPTPGMFNPFGMTPQFSQFGVTPSGMMGMTPHPHGFGPMNMPSNGGGFGSFQMTPGPSGAVMFGNPMAMQSMMPPAMPNQANAGSSTTNVTNIGVNASAMRDFHKKNITTPGGPCLPTVLEFQDPVDPEKKHSLSIRDTDKKKSGKTPEEKCSDMVSSVFKDDLGSFFAGSLWEEDKRVLDEIKAENDRLDAELEKQKVAEEKEKAKKEKAAAKKAKDASKTAADKKNKRKSGSSSGKAPVMKKMSKAKPTPKKKK